MKSLTKPEINASTHPVRILQFGEGNFLRGFVDYMVDVANEKIDFNSNVQLVQPIPQGLKNLLDKQDSLYHVLLQGLKNGKSYEETRLITCLEGINNPYDSYEDYLALGENPELRFIISNTTEAGIQFDPEDKNPGILPKTFPGKLSALLYHRFVHFEGDSTKGLILIPCELIDKNGENLKKCILDYASLWELPTHFSEWIEQHCIFCNTLVDRIVPGFPRDTIADIQKNLGYEDNLVVMAEPFHLWVIEGPAEVEKEFPLHKAGLDVKFVTNQTPYRTRKVRILNGAHTSLVPYAYLQGLRTVRESVEHPEVGTWLRELIFEEIVPTLDMDQTELKAFADAVLERFANPFIVHELKSIALNSISKFKVRVLPSLLAYHEQKNKWPEKLITAFATTILFYKGKVAGETMPLNDDQEILEFFAQAWNDRENLVTTVLQNTSLWGQDLSQQKGLASVLEQALLQLEGILSPS